MPQVAVILPVYNAAPFLAGAVRSILHQTHADLLLLALNDGSTDDSPAILQSLAAQDPRLQIFYQPNAGAVASFNRLIDLALPHNSDFIALMHADDLALPTRVQKQLAYFTTHPEISILGTWIESFLTPAPNSGRQPGASSTEPHLTPRPWHYPHDPRFTKPSLLFWCCFAHPTIMFRRHVLAGTPSSGADALVGRPLRTSSPDAPVGRPPSTNDPSTHPPAPPLRYDPDFPMPCEDYALWARASQHHLMSNVPEVLLHYRLHPAQGGLQHHTRTAALTTEIRRRQIALLGISPTPAQLSLHQRLAENDFPLPSNAGVPPAVVHDAISLADFLPATRSWLERLWHANDATPIYDPEAFSKILAARWAAACLHAAQHLPDPWPQFHASPLSLHLNRSLEKYRLIPPPP